VHAAAHIPESAHIAVSPIPLWQQYPSAHTAHVQHSEARHIDSSLTRIGEVQYSNAVFNADVVCCVCAQTERRFRASQRCISLSLSLSLSLCVCVCVCVCVCLCNIPVRSLKLCVHTQTKRSCCASHRCMALRLSLSLSLSIYRSLFVCVCLCVRVCVCGWAGRTAIIP